MADLPECVIVAGQRFTVVAVHGPASPVSNGEVLGRTNVDNGTIAINAREGKQSPDQMRDTLLHETLHAIFQLGALQAHLRDGGEEAMIQVIATLLLDTLRRNPQLVAYLVAP